MLKQEIRLKVTPCHCQRAPQLPAQKMQNEYIQLYELIRRRASQLEQSWRSLQSQLKPLDLNAFPELPSSSNKATARRIKPTQLSTSAALSSAPLAGDEIPCTPISRPLNTSTVAWKKISTPLKTFYSHENNDEEEEDDRASASGLKEAFNALPNREALHEFSRALHQIIFCFSLDEANRFVFNFASGIGALCKILAVGDEVCGISSRAGKVNAFLSGRMDGGELACPMELFYIAAQCAHLATPQLRLFFPDSLQRLHKNALLCLFGFSEAFKSESSLAATSHQKNDSLAVAYSNLRDSRNFFTDPTAHANQQRIRDLFLNLIRFHLANDYSSSSSTSAATGTSSNRRGFAGKVAEITGRLVGGGSYAWMAELFLTEYLQVQEMRIDRLEERIKGAGSNNNSTGSNTPSHDATEVFWLFLQQADSFKLTRAVEGKAIQSLTALLEAANQRRSTWSDSVRKARFLTRVIAFCRYRLDEESSNEGEEDLLVFGWVRGAVEGKWMLTALPCLFEYFSMLPTWGIKQRCQNTLKLLLKYHQVKFQKGRRLKSRALFLIKMGVNDLLRDCCPTDLINELSLELSESTEPTASTSVDYSDDSIEEDLSTASPQDNCPVDEDDYIPGASTTFRSISAQLKYFHTCFNGIIKIGNNATNASSSNTRSSNASTTLSTTTSDTPRKIRPITQVAASELKQQRLQKQLRQWFWWRYGSQRVLVDALVSFILEQRIFPRYPKTANTLLTRTQNIDDCKRDFKEIFLHFLPLLMPPFWQSNGEMAELFLGLSLELAKKQIISHFS